MPVIALRSQLLFLSFQGVTGEIGLDPDTAQPGPGTDWTPLVACRLEAQVNHQGRAIQLNAGRRVDFGGDAPLFVIAKLTDAATIGLMREFLAGSDPRAAHVVFLRTGDDGRYTEYLRYELKGCTVATFEMVGVGADRTAEEYGILYQQLDLIAFAKGHGAKGARSSTTLLNGA